MSLWRVALPAPPADPTRAEVAVVRSGPHGNIRPALSNQKARSKARGEARADVLRFKRTWLSTMARLARRFTNQKRLLPKKNIEKGKSKKTTRKKETQRERSSV